MASDNIVDGIIITSKLLFVHGTLHGVYLSIIV
jgi:hypothetical protein